MENLGYIKLRRGDATLELLTKHPKCFILLTQIAYRARRTSCLDLEIGESKIGDYKACGLTRQEYRTTLKQLTANQLITIKATNRGTIAKLVNSAIYDINSDGLTTKLTSKQPSANHQATTNKNVRMKECNKHYVENPESMKLSRLLFELIKGNESGFKEPDLKHWARDIDKIIRIDKRDSHLIERVIRYSQSDSFQKAVIISPVRLRKHFTSLIMRMDGNSRNSGIKSFKKAEEKQYRVDVCNNNKGGSFGSGST